MCMLNYDFVSRFKLDLLWLFIVLTLLVVVFFNQNQLITALYATHPRDFIDIHTSLTGSWLHGNFDHLLGNILSLTGLGVVFILLFRNQYLFFFIIQWVLSGLILFFVGRNGQSHIGASTWAYSFAAFLGVIALLHPNNRAKSILFLVTLFYGSMWWGLLPILPGISWQGHLSGTIAGILIALFKIDFWIDKMYLPKLRNKIDAADSDGYEEIPSNPFDEF